ncbi:bifunctional folylpolyglutamate synthase/dihydrofolate synthase [Metabacillus sp. RGM 3146]|uniref:bifunctional folylpolyglutamate synthase/dihydrofolate synthase n=1 Tax=Metabacillus sp. RGM 3146 TaxID=3401092 RepID=UPI003B9A4FE9
MFMSYEEALHWIHSRLKFGIKPGLIRMQKMMEKLGHPEKEIPIIHVGGTNGKGSTVAYLRSIFNEAGYSAGTFTSPYLETFNERISMDGTPISDQSMIDLVNRLKPIVEELEETELGSPTEFEVITAMAFYYFGRIAPPDILLLEVGLGGKWDSTNIIHPLLSIITTVGHDHMNILGNSIAEIAGEKAGIIKENAPVISGAENLEAALVIGEKALAENAPLYELNQEIIIQEAAVQEDGEVFSVTTPFSAFKKMNIHMTGIHQMKNASLAVMAAELLNKDGIYELSEDHIRKGLQEAYWNGRFEIISEVPKIILDGAHNREGVESLVNTLLRHYPDKKIRLLFAALEDKEYSLMVSQLEGVADHLYFASFDFPRAASAETLYKSSNHSRKLILPDWQHGIKKIAGEMKEDELFVITGSLYFISQVRKSLIEKNRLC